MKPLGVGNGQFGQNLVQHLAAGLYLAELLVLCRKSNPHRVLPRDSGFLQLHIHPQAPPLAGNQRNAPRGQVLE